MEDLKKCCFCGKKIGIFDQNNPSPADTNEDAVCCLECNYNIVIPARTMISTLVKEALAGNLPGPDKWIQVPDYSELLILTKSLRAGDMTNVNKEVMEDGTIRYSVK